MIKQAFLHVEVIGPHVNEGRYDLVDPRGNIVLPSLWEMLVEPNWTVTMHMWPLPDIISPEEAISDVREAGQADPRIESGIVDQTVGRLDDHVEVWILQPQVHFTHCGYDIRYGAKRSLIPETDSKLRRQKFRRWKGVDVVSQLTKLLTKEREAVDDLFANISQQSVRPVQLTILDVVFQKMNPSKEPNTAMPWRSVVLYIQVICNTKPSSEALVSSQDLSIINSNVSIIQGPPAHRSENEDHFTTSKAAAAAMEIAIAEATSAAAFPEIGHDADSSSLQSVETSDDEESDNVTPEMARKIVDDLLAEYTTLHV